MKTRIEKTASGLRAMETTPDFFLFCGDSDWTWSEKEILGIPVLHSALITDMFTDSKVDFIPLWNEENEDVYISERRRFNDGYAD